MIEFKSVSKVYPDGTHAVRDLSFAIHPGEICVLIGPSGCGKTTALRMINRLVEPTSGQIYVNDEDNRKSDPIELRKAIGYAIQETALFPHMTVGENIGVVPRLRRWPRSRREARVSELLDLVGLKPSRYRDKYPLELSGGERQRVGVARALGADPPILLMDEPFGAIDPITRLRLQDEFLAIQAKVQKTVVFVTHDISEALKLGDEIAIMRQGSLVQFGSPKEILARPADPFVEDFIGGNRTMKWLQMVRVSEVMLRYRDTPSSRAVFASGNMQASGDPIDETSPLADALIRLATAEADFLPVVDPQRRPIGVVTADCIAGEIRKSLGLPTRERRSESAGAGV